ncbi:MAG: polysaccharide biosynthesis tyrosine autokinase [Bryobacteraceae bacterium]
MHTDLIPSPPLPVPEQWKPAREINLVPDTWQESSATIGETARLMLRHKFRFLAIVVGGMLMGQAVNMLQTPMYRSESTIEVQGINENYLNLRDVDPVAPLSPQTMDSYIQTQVEILRNPALLEPVVVRLHLAGREEFRPSPNWIARAASMADVALPGALSANATTLDKVLDNLRVYQLRQSRLIRVSFDSEDPKLAAGVLNALLQEYAKQTFEARWQTSLQTRDLLTSQLEDLRSRLERSEYELQRYASANGLLFSTGKESIGEDRLRQIQAELFRAQSNRIQKEALVQAAASAPAGSLPSVLDNGGLRAYQNKLGDLKRELADLSSFYQPESYKVSRVQAQIDQVEASIQTEVADVRNRIKREHEVAVAQERQLAEAYRTQAHVLSEQSSKAVRYNVLLREVETNRLLYDGMLQKVKDARIASAIRASNVRPIGPVQPPALPYRPNVPLNLAVGLGLGLTLAAGSVLLQRRSDLPVSAPGEMFLSMNLPELGAIPRMNVSRVTSSLPTLLGSRPARTKVELVTLDHKLSDVSESFRNTLASIVLPGAETSPKVLVVTSANAREGKTTVASNLGVALADIGRNVLLVDADIRNPQLQNVFGIPNTWGLSDLLRDPSAVSRLPREGLSKCTSVPRLWILTSGPPAKDWHELLHSRALALLLRQMRDQFDHILLDAPPSLLYSDARVLGRHSDGVILVVRANHTSRGAVHAVIRRLRADGLPLKGAILNDWNPQTQGDAYGYDELRKYSKHYEQSVL